MQGTIKLSVLVAFRDRELTRVDRFLAGLAGQSFRDFELIFLDYGSRPELAAEVRGRLAPLSWARYVRNESTGQPWNRAHALNSAARLARGEYLLCTDIDLVYAPAALGQLAAAAAPGALVGASFQLLPPGFARWERLAAGEAVDAPTSHANTLGAVQLLSKEAFFSVRGFDEFFRIWGVEDFDFQARLQQAGLHSRRVEGPAIYHQWHPSAAVPDMPLGWLEVMNFHSLVRTSRDLAPAGDADWGRCLTASDRPALAVDAANARTIYLPSRHPALADFAAWKRIDFMRTLLRDLAAAAPGTAFVCHLDHAPATRLKSLLARTLLRWRYRPLAGKRCFDHRAEGRAILWYIIVLSGLVADYAIENGPHSDRYTLVRR